MKASEEPQKDMLVHYLVRGREALLWKLDGLSEYDVRRPLTPTGSNLLGLLKHVSLTSAEYFGLVFDRPFPGMDDWMTDDSPDNADMWATADQSREDVIELWHRSWAHADETIAAHPLSAVGRVPWWPPERSEISLHTVLVHNVDELARHAGHADILRELIDGGVGLGQTNSNLPDHDNEWWTAYRATLQDTADRFR